MRLGIFGDSFSESIEEIGHGVTTISWPHELARLLKMDFDNFSYAGTSAWYSYKHFLENYHKYTHVVFTYTESNRWPSLPDELKRFSSIYSEEKLSMFPAINKDETKFIKSLIAVHRYIFDEQFNNFVLQQIFNQVNTICKENNINLINVLPFVGNHFGDEIDLTSMHGSCLTNVISISLNEIRDISTSVLHHSELECFESGPDYRKNHLNELNNIVLSNIILEEFNNKARVINVFDDDRFVYDPSILIDYKEKLKKVLNVQ